MSQFLKRLQSGGDCYDVEQTGFGIVLVRRQDCDEKFSRLVTGLLDWYGDEFVVLPVADADRGYERVVLLPY